MCQKENYLFSLQLELFACLFTMPAEASHNPDKIKNMDISKIMLLILF